MTRFRNKRAAERTVAALRAAGRLEEVDAAAIATFTTLSEQLDSPDMAPAELAAIARVQLSALKLVRGLGDNGNDDDALAGWLAAIASPPPLGDTEEP
jgi:hypothetical protein